MDPDFGRFNTKFRPSGPSNGNAKTNKRGKNLKILINWKFQERKERKGALGYLLH